MTISLLTSGIRINGVEQVAGSQWSLTTAAEAQLVGRGVAQYVEIYEGAPAGLNADARIVPPGYDTRLDRQWNGMLVEAVRFSTADGQIVPEECALLGVRPNSGTSPTLDLHNGTSTAGIMVLGGLGVLTVGTLYLAANGALVHCPLGLYGNLGGTTPVFTVYLIRA